MAEIVVLSNDEEGIKVYNPPFTREIATSLFLLLEQNVKQNLLSELISTWLKFLFTVF